MGILKAYFSKAPDAAVKLNPQIMPSTGSQLGYSIRWDAGDWGFTLNTHGQLQDLFDQ